MFQLVWVRRVANSIDRQKIDFASSRRGSLRQHLGFGSQGYKFWKTKRAGELQQQGMDLPYSKQPQHDGSVTDV